MNRRHQRWIRIARILWAVAMLAASVAVVVAVRTWVATAGGDVRWTLDGREFRFLEPDAFALAALVPLLWAVQAWTLSDFGFAQRILNGALRAVVVLALAGALARPATSRQEARVCAVAVVDTSASVTDELLAAAHARVEALRAARGTHLVRLVTFAESARVVPIPPGATPLPPLRRDEGPEAMGTNPAQALRLAFGLCPQDHLRRVLLMTDGADNRGDVVAEAARAREAGVVVHQVELPWTVPPEIFVRDLEIPPEVRLSEPFRMVVVVHATTPTTARLDITQNGLRDVRARPIQLDAGVNRIDVDLEVWEPGMRHFEVVVSPDGPDRFPENNRYTRSFEVRGRPRVLYVEGEDRARGYLQRALDRQRNDLANFDLDVRSATGLPTRIEELSPFDLVVLSDVPARVVPRDALVALRQHVRDNGAGLILAGGENAFGPGGWDNTLLEDISPVEFDLQRLRELPSLAILLVIDRSGSMDGAKLELAKEAARAVVDMLGPQDFVGVVAFDSEAQTVVRLQQASNRTRIRNDIGRIAPGGGTEILPALQEAWIQLVAQPARLKHVILLTDGEAPWDGILRLTGTMRIDGITVSSVAVGREADRSLLTGIAETGGGRFYATNDPGNIPQIFIQETSQVSRTNLIEEPFRARSVRRSAATRGIDWERSPWLLGYVSTRPRRGAEVILETERGEPLLATWRQGLGKVAVFTSDVKNRWAVEWVRDRIHPQFWAQLVRDTMRGDSDEVLAMSASVRAGRVSLAVDAIDERDRFVNGLDSVVRLTGPEGQTVDTSLAQVAAGRYEASVPIDAWGTWHIRAEHRRDGRTLAISSTTVTWPWPEELELSGPRHDAGRRLAQATGGRIDPDDDSVFDTTGLETEVLEERWIPLVFLALLALLLDLLLRRVRIGRGRPLRWLAVVGER